MKSAALLILGAWMSAGCTGSHIGNPSARLSLSLTGYDGTANGALTLSSGTVVDEAWIVLDRIRLRSSDECSRRDDSTDVPAPIAAELVGGRMAPGRPELEARATSYCRVELRFHELEAGELVEVPAELGDRSILVRGARADGVAFEIAADFRDSFRLDAEAEPFAVPEGEAGLLVGFAMDEWLDGAALEAAEIGTRDGAPFIAITSGDNDPLYRGFRDAVRRSARLFRDEDRDGTLDGGERAEVLGVGILE